MKNTSVNMESLLETVSKRKLKFDSVKQDFTKVAFDIYRKNDGAADELWQIQNADDGSEYIVALYDEDERVITASVKSPWTVAVKNSDLHIFYKGAHLCKVASADLGFAESDVALAKQYLPSKLAANKNLVKSLLKSVDQVVLKSMLSKYPELA
jgi:hypothetical protein